MIKDEDFKRITIEELRHPVIGGLYRLYIDYWWETDIDGLALLYKGTRPQCNADKTIVTSLDKNRGNPVFLTKAFVSVSHEDLIG